MSVFPWAITRTDADARRVCDDLRAQGVDAFPLPCIERVMRSVPPWHPEGHRVVVLTSVGAVTAVASSLLKAAPNELATIAPTTSQAVRELGFRPTIEGFAGVVALAEAIEQRLSRRGVVDPAFWYPTSDAGTTTAEQSEAVARLERLGPVTRPVVYETRAPEALPAAMAELPPNYGVFFASPSAVTNFFTALPPKPAPVRVVCWGESTVRAARQHFPDAVEADRQKPLAHVLTEKEHDDV